LSENESTYTCPDCGAAMVIIETFVRGQLPRAPPVGVIGNVQNAA